MIGVTHYYHYNRVDSDAERGQDDDEKNKRVHQ